MKQKIAALVLQLAGKKRGIDFAPMIHFQKGMHIIIESCFRILEDNPLVLDIRHTQNEIFFICAAPDKKACLEVLSLTDMLETLIETVNIAGEKDHWNFSFVPHYAIDRGWADQIPFETPTRFSSLSIWTGNVLSRSQSLALIAQEDHLSRRIITHSFYTALPKNIQHAFSTPYYRLHICCYGENH